MGTRAESGSCVFCDTITYQDELGQNVCKPCPSGFRTIVIGASDISECTEAIERLTEFSSTTTVAHETTDGTKKLPPVTSAVEPHTSSSTPTTDSLPDSTTSKRSTSPSTSEAAKTNMPVPLGQDNTSAFGIGAIIGIVVGCLALMLSVFAVTSVAYRARTRKRKRQRDRGISFDNLYILRPERGPATNVIFGGHNRSTEVYDEIPPPAYSCDSNPYLHAVTSFTNSDTSKDSVTDDLTDYLTPSSATLGKRSSTVINTDCTLDTNYLHARSSMSVLQGKTSPTAINTDCKLDSIYLYGRSSMTNENKDTSGEDYATIPLARIDASTPPPYNEMK